MKKFTKEERQAIIWQVKDQILKEDEAKRAELYANYKPSKLYVDVQTLLNQARANLEKAASLSTPLIGYTYCGCIDAHDIEYTLKSIQDKEINFQYRTVNKNALESKIILMSMKEDVDIDTIVSELVASIK